MTERVKRPKTSYDWEGKRGHRFRFHLANGMTITGTLQPNRNDKLLFIDVEGYQALHATAQDVNAMLFNFEYDRENEKIVPFNTYNDHQAVDVVGYEDLGQVPFFGASFKKGDKLRLRIKDEPERVITATNATTFDGGGNFSLTNVSGFDDDETYGVLILKDGVPTLHLFALTRMKAFYYQVVGLTNLTSHEENVGVLFSRLLPPEITHQIAKYGGTRKRRRYARRSRR
jgi:hypothetical protein